MGIIMSREEVTALMNKRCGQSINIENMKKGIFKGVAAIEAGDYEKTTHKDFYKYFVKKAKEHKLDYVSSKNSLIKEYAVLKSLLMNYSPALVKAMIDFLWDGQHKLAKNKYDTNIFMLSKGYLNKVVPEAEKWLQGNRNYCDACDPRLRIENKKGLDEGGVWVAGIRLC